MLQMMKMIGTNNRGNKMRKNKKITVNDLKVVQELRKENVQLKAENEKLLQDLEKITEIYIKTCKKYSEQIQRMQAQNVQEICEKKL